MKTPGPYQHCTACAAETAHHWVESNIYICSVCGKQTKVATRPPLTEEQLAIHEHLPKEALKDIVQDPPQKELKKKEPEVEKPFVSDVPVQGLFTKPTPLEDYPTTYLEEHGKMPASEILERYADQLTDVQKEKLTNIKTVQMGENTVSYVPLPGFDDIKSAPDSDSVHVHLPVKKKGWADDL